MQAKHAVNEVMWVCTLRAPNISQVTLESTLRALNISKVMWVCTLRAPNIFQVMWVCTYIYTECIPYIPGHMGVHVFCVACMLLNITIYLLLKWRIYTNINNKSTQMHTLIVPIDNLLWNTKTSSYYSHQMKSFSVWTSLSLMTLL